MYITTTKEYFPNTSVIVIKTNAKHFSKALQNFKGMEDEFRGFTIIDTENHLDMIILNRDGIEDDMIETIIIAHELGHINVGLDEEDADRYALNLLADSNFVEEYELLKSQWEIRHGKPFVFKA